MKKYIALMVIPILLTGCVRKSEYEKSQSALAKSQSDLAAAQEKIKALEAELAELRPLAVKARQLPISTSINKHAIPAGYSLAISNQSRVPLRLSIVVTANGQSKNSSVVVDGGKVYVVTGLVPHDTVTIGSEGYDPVTIDIK